MHPNRSPHLDRPFHAYTSAPGMSTRIRRALVTAILVVVGNILLGALFIGLVKFGGLPGLGVFLLTMVFVIVFLVAFFFDY